MPVYGRLKATEESLDKINATLQEKLNAKVCPVALRMGNRSWCRKAGNRRTSREANGMVLHETGNA